MYFTTIIITTIAALAMSGNAAPAPAAYTRYAQLRLYGEPGCSAQNLGELGIYDINQCKSFGDTDVIRSVSFEVNTSGCTRKSPISSIICYKDLDRFSVHVYNDVTCHLNDHIVTTVGTCLAGDDSYKNYVLRCDF